MDYKKPKVTLLQASPLFVSEIAARVCYDSFAMSEHDDIKTYGTTGSGDSLTSLQDDDIEGSDVLDKLTWAFFHESILEHSSLSFYVEDLSREVLQEVARHRIGMAISVKSTRYTIEKLVDAVSNHFNLLENNPRNNYTDEMKDSYQKICEVVRDNIIVSDEKWIDIEVNTLMAKLELYHIEEPLVAGLKGSKKKKQNDRVKRCLPETWTTKTVLTFNVRALKHFIELRDSGSAYFGIRELALAIIKCTPEKYMRFVRKPDGLHINEAH
jgi:thymidylate synthase (FAD)